MTAMTIMNARLPQNASRRPANVSINAELLEKAKRLGINLSHALEARLAELVREAEAQAWLEQKQRAIDAFNRRVEREGRMTPLVD